MMGSFFVILESNLFHTQQKFFSKTSRATDTEVDAPGDSPNNAITEWSLELTTSVPN